MSHTFTSGKCRIHYNSDLSGEVYIMRESEEGATITGIKIPGTVLVEFMKYMGELEEIARIERGE